jgi:hypothetical protein
MRIAIEQTRWIRFARWVQLDSLRRRHGAFPLQRSLKPDTVRHLINRTLRKAENRAVEEMRELENVNRTFGWPRSVRIVSGPPFQDHS